MKKKMSFTSYNYEHLYKHLPYIIWETTNVYKKQPIKKHPLPPKKSTKGTKNIFWVNLWYFIIIDVIILFLFDYEFNLGIYGIL